MWKKWSVISAFIFIFGVLIYLTTPSASLASVSYHSSNSRFFSSLSPTPIFKNPVVSNAPVSGYFDHYENGNEKKIVFYDGRQNNGPSYGFQFTCSNPSMDDFIGCIDNASGEANCERGKQLWYNDHQGIDYEYSDNWYTGATCDVSRFTGITRKIYSPAQGRVAEVGYNHQFNGNYIFLKHDLNNNGNYDDDNFRSAYLHFALVSVLPGQIIKKGQYLGEGGSTGYSSTPHLHFQVQRSTDNFVNSKWSVDPYGWKGTGTDPWPHPNYPLWKYENYVPFVKNDPLPTSACIEGVNMIKNGGFELGNTHWAEAGLNVVTGINDSFLKVKPYEGSWLVWFGGRNNAVDSISQSFVVPPLTVSGDLRFLILMGTDENDESVYDTLTVKLYNSSGGLIQTVRSFDDNYPHRGVWYITHSHPSLLAYQGQTLTLKFEAKTNSSRVSNFYLDGVYFNTECANPALPPSDSLVISQPTPTSQVGSQPMKP